MNSKPMTNKSDLLFLGEKQKIKNVQYRVIPTKPTLHVPIPKSIFDQMLTSPL
jgi:hypothetical protein